MGCVSKGRVINWAAPIRAKQSESCEWAYRIGKLGVGRHIVVVTELETGGQSLFLVNDAGESQLLKPAYPEFSGPQFENHHENEV